MNNLKYKSFLDYVNIVRGNLIYVITIFLVFSTLTICYSIIAKNKYTAQAILKISQPEGNILDASSFLPKIGDNKADRFISNEIQTMVNITIRKQVAQEILDSIKNLENSYNIDLFKNKTNFFIMDQDSFKTEKEIEDDLIDIVNIEQKEGLDFIEISAQSSSPYEAALIVNTYARVYRRFNLLDNRKQVARVKEFLGEEKNKKYQDLIVSENNYKIYQLRGGAVRLDDQARTLIESMTELESHVNENSIELAIAEQSLSRYKEELKNKDQTLSQHLETKASEPYLISLQTQIAELETQRDIVAITSKINATTSKVILDYNEKIKELKSKLRESTELYQSSVLSASPEEIKELSRSIFELEVRYNSLLASNKQMESHLQSYEKRFDALPERSIDLARLERQRQGSEKIYLLLEEKYQEALINEQSIEGNILILNYADIPELPSDPNRIVIILMGIILGLTVGIGFAIIRDSLNNSIKTPDDVEELNLKLLGWIPLIQKNDEEENSEFIVAKQKNDISDDSFKTIRTMLKNTNSGSKSKSILITSAAQSEGKSLLSLNLAGSFAQVNKKTILVDCDLRKPRIHNILKLERVPGFTDFFVGKAHFEKIIKPTGFQNLNFISAGQIPQNPTEILDSRGMKTFLEKLKLEYDVVIIDSPPLFGLADALILSQIVDETILVAKADSTDQKLLLKSVSLLNNVENPSFSGVVLNGFNLRRNYGTYYFKYSQNYTYKSNGRSKVIKNKFPKVK